MKRAVIYIDEGENKMTEAELQLLVMEVQQ